MDNVSRKELLAGIAVIVVVVAILSSRIYNAMDSVTQSTEVKGTLDMLYTPPSTFGAGPTWWSIRLPSDQFVSVYAPQGAPYRAGASVVLTRDQTAHGHVNYSFKAYFR